MSKTYDEKSNRDRLRRIRDEIEEIAADEAISPAPFGYLVEAQELITKAMQFALDTKERDGMKATI